MAAAAILSNAGPGNSFGSLLAKRRYRPNMKINANNNSVSFYNTDVPDFGRFLLSETFADVQLVCGENRISAHRSRLGAVSPFLASLFALDTSETSIVILPDIKYETMRVLVHFLYTGFIRVSKNEIHDLLEAGCLLGIDKSIDVEQFDFGGNIATEGTSKRKRQAAGGGKSEIQKKKKKTIPTQTVVIVDKFQGGNKMLPHGLSQPTSDPLDVASTASNNVITLEDSSVQDASDDEEMEICLSPSLPLQETVTVQGNASVTTAASNSEIASTSHSNEYSEPQPVAATEVGHPVILAVQSSNTLMKETEEVSKDNTISQSPQTPKTNNDSVPNSGQTPKEKGDPEQQNRLEKVKSPSFQGEFQNLDTNTTPCKDTGDVEMKLAEDPVVPMTVSDSPMESGRSSSASTCPAPSPTPSSLHSEREVNVDSDLQGENKSESNKETTPAVSVGTKDAEVVTNIEESTDKIQISGIQSMSKPVNTSSEICTEATTPSSKQKTSQHIDSSPMQNPVPTGQPESAERSSTSLDSPSQRPGLSKTVQQAVAGLLMWKSSKQKQASKSEVQPSMTSPTLPQNISPSMPNEPRMVEKRITVLTPKVPLKISEQDKEIIAKTLCNEMQEESDPLADDPSQTPEQQDSSQ